MRPGLGADCAVTQKAYIITQYAKGPHAGRAVTEDPPGNPCGNTRAAREGLVRLGISAPDGCARIKPATGVARPQRSGHSQDLPSGPDGVLPGQHGFPSLLGFAR